jgi:two-component system NtrC family sensor kinase
MRLTARLLSLLLLGALVLLVIDTYSSIQREVSIVERDMRSSAGLMARAMRGILADVWSTRGERRALELIRDANEAEESVLLRWVWLDPPPGDSMRPLVPAERLDPVRHGREVSVRDRTGSGEQYLRTYVPFPPMGGRQGALEISQSLAVLEERTRAIIVRRIILALGLALVGAVLAVGVGVGLVGHRLRRMEEKILRVGEGDLSAPLVVGGHDELSEVARGLNHMCERLEESQARVARETEARIAALDALRHADRLRTVGQLASGIAHELGTPLNVVSGRADLIASGSLSAGEIVESARIIHTQSDRMAAIVRQLLDFARRRPPARECADLLDIARECLQLVDALARKRDIRLSLGGESVRTKLDRGQVQQVLMNLLVNALQASPQRGTVEAHVAWERRRPPAGQAGGEGKYASVQIRDHGEGISKENVERIFEPFFTTKGVGEGTGLGLSTALGIVRDHGGWIDVQSELGAGSRFTVYLPEEACAWPAES